MSLRLVLDNVAPVKLMLAANNETAVVNLYINDHFSYILPVPTFDHKNTAKSMLPEANNCPSSLKDINRIPCVCPFKIEITCLLSISHTHNV